MKSGEFNMSTKATIAHSDSWHLYEELMDSPPDNIMLDYGDFRCKIPWEAALAIKEHVEAQLEMDANLKDPKWLMDKISEYQEQLCDTEPGFYSELVKGWIEDLQDRLVGLQAKEEDSGI